MLIIWQGTDRSWRSWRARLLNQVFMMSVVIPIPSSRFWRHFRNQSTQMWCWKNMAERREAESWKDPGNTDTPRATHGVKQRKCGGTKHSNSEIPHLLFLRLILTVTCGRSRGGDFSSIHSSIYTRAADTEDRSPSKNKPARLKASRETFTKAAFERCHCCVSEVSDGDRGPLTESGWHLGATYR